MHSTTRVRAAALLLAGTTALSACGNGSAERSGDGASASSSTGSISAGDPASAGQDTGDGSSREVCVDQFGATWPGPADPGLVHYDDTTGLLWMDECGNSYGHDGRLVQTPDGVCVHGIAPGFEDQPERNVCLDPSLTAVTEEWLDGHSEEWAENGWEVTVGG